MLWTDRAHLTGFKVCFLKCVQNVRAVRVVAGDQKETKASFSQENIDVRAHPEGARVDRHLSSISTRITTCRDKTGETKIFSTN